VYISRVTLNIVIESLHILFNILY